MKTLIITSCTKDKIHDIEGQLSKYDFLDHDTLTKKEKELISFKTKAKDIYKGRQHLRVMEGINHLRENLGNNVVDLAIVSAGYGLLDENDEIVPYNVTFAEMKKSEVIEWSKHLNINEDTSKKIKSYDLVFFLLGEEYLRSLELPFIETRDDQKLIFLGSKASKKLIPSYPPYYYLEVGHQDAKAFGEMSISVKGYLFKLLSQEVVLNGLEILTKVYDEPQSFLQILNRYRKSNMEDKIEQLSLFPEKDTKLKKNNIKKEDEKMKQTVMPIPNNLYAKNYGFHEMKYFMPENDDRVDPNFNFITEEHTKDRNPLIDDVYAHEIYEKPNYDGVLISKINIDQTQTRKQQILDAGGLHEFLRLPPNIPLYGDCGAFSYIQKDEPPYKTEEILEYYDKMGFDIGVSIDHLIIGDITKDKKKRQYRFNLTLKNAQDFLIKHKEGNYNFKPSGIAQGWDVESYREAVSQLIEMGYKHISLGGLAYAKSEEILAVLIAIAPLLPEYMEVHLFGAARLDSLQLYHQLGITSFDSTSYLKKAWGGASGGNYFTIDKKKYAAVRVPQADIKKNARIKELVHRGIGTLAEFKQLEEESLSRLRDFSKGIIDADSTIETVIKYDSYFETLKSYKKQYKLEKDSRDQWIADNLYIQKSELGKIETKIQKQLKKMSKKLNLSQLEEYLAGDVSLHMFIKQNEVYIKAEFEESLFNTVKEMGRLEIEIIQKENLTLLSSTLKGYFVQKYETIFINNKLKDHYRLVLEDQPWKKCSCRICQNVGVEVIIFRGNNRNRRRGFHNTYVFYNQFKEIMNQSKERS